jgi:hypothetical protein
MADIFLLKPAISIFPTLAGSIKLPWLTNLHSTYKTHECQNEYANAKLRLDLFL